MEKKKNPISSLISSTFKSGDVEKLNYVFKMIKESPDSCNEEISAIDMDKLNKLCHKCESIQSRFAASLIYNLIFSKNLIEIQTLESNKIIEIVNSMYLQYEFLKGTKLAKKLRGIIRNLLMLLRKRPELTHEDILQIEEILERPDIKLDVFLSNFDNNEEIKTLIENLSAHHFPHKQDGLISLIEVLSRSSSIEEQYEIIFNKSKVTIEPALVGLNEKVKPILEIICIYMEHILFQSEFLIRLQKSLFDPKFDLESSPSYINYIPQEESTIVNDDDSFKPEYHTIIPFRLTEEENFLKSNERIVPVIIKILTVLSKFNRDITIQRNCLTIVERLYYLFPKLRQNLEEMIVTLMNSINNDKNEDSKKEASSFLYRLVYRDASFEFKQQIEKRESFKTLYETKYFNKIVLDNTENIFGSVNLRDVQIKTGFPITKLVDSGETYHEYIEVWKPFSILYWAIILEAHDINITVSKVVTFEKAMNGIKEEPRVIYQGKKIEASEHHARWTVIAKDPGIYKIEFDNSYSWFKSKNFKLLVSVLEPDIDILMNLSRKPNIVTSTTEEKKLEEKREMPIFSNSFDKDNEAKVKGLIYINPTTIDFHLSSNEKSFEMMINYTNESINWDQINDRLFETIRKSIEIGRTTQENKFTLKIIYSIRAFKSLFPDLKYEMNDFEAYKTKLLSVFTFLSKVSNNLSQGLVVYEDIDCMLTTLLNNKLYSEKDVIYSLSIDNFAKMFRGKCKNKTIEIENYDLNRLSLPFLNKEEGYTLRAITDMYFEEKTLNAKISYLASLMITILSTHNFQITHFHILQGDNLDPITSEQEKLLRKLIKSYLEKYEKSLEIIFNELKMSEILNL